jgi:hypothetical protein
MTCEWVKLPDDAGYAMVCGRGPRRRFLCRWCGEHADYQCDHPHPGHKSGTCDAWICRRHRTVGGHNIDYCPPHTAGPARPKPVQLKMEL